jgi:predicted lipid-binding transport protein (Tim44 family)
MTFLDTSQYTAIEAAGRARLHDYLRRAQPVSEADELIARAAFLDGFRMGSRWAVRTCTALSDPRFREALEVVAEACKENGL